MTREKHSNREEWLTARNKPMSGIGGSDAALICGCEGAFGNLDELYNTKKGIVAPRQFTNARIEDGIASEPHIRDLFAIIYADRYKVEYNGYDIIRSDERPYAFCTLDGELTDLRTSANGILEIKKIKVNSKADMAAWENGNVPEKYLIQQLWQLYCTGWDFNILTALIDKTNWHKEGTDLVAEDLKDIEFRQNIIRRSDPDFKENMDWVLEKTDRFWNDMVADRRPPLRLF